MAHQHTMPIGIGRPLLEVKPSSHMALGEAQSSRRALSLASMGTDL